MGFVERSSFQSEGFFFISVESVSVSLSIFVEWLISLKLGRPLSIEPVSVIGFISDRPSDELLVLSKGKGVLGCPCS